MGVSFRLLLGLRPSNDDMPGASNHCVSRWYSYLTYIEPIHNDPIQSLCEWALR